MIEGLDQLVSGDDTIVAIATPVGRSGIGVVRLSGSNALAVAERYLRSARKLEPREAVHARWVSETGEAVDRVIVTYFRGPRSYTGEDVIEISAHGNPLVLGQIVSTLESAGARMARAGEFTLRAVVHGKMDLVQAEAVREFIEAQTAGQARIALQQMEGALSRKVRPIREQLIGLVAELEAGIDFGEDDVDVPDNGALSQRLRQQCEALRMIEATFGYGQILAEGVRLAVIGKPNVGKSSLFNRILAADRAIVTEIPGTTRDVLTETVNLDGIPLRVADTAGVRRPRDTVEAIGVGRTLETLAESDLALVVCDGSRPFDEDDRLVLERAAAIPHLRVINKVDLPQQLDAAASDWNAAVRISAKTGHGLDVLLEAIRHTAVSEKLAADELVLTSARQHEAVRRAGDAVSAGSGGLDRGTPHEMVLVDLYEALGALGELTGEVVTEDILDRIFATFCVGK